MSCIINSPRHGSYPDCRAPLIQIDAPYTVDNGTEFTSKALDEWAYRRGVKLDYTRPGKPTDNGLIESFNGRLRDEFLNTHEFVTMQDVRERLKAWKDDYNTERPHGSLGHLTPSEFAKARSGQPSKGRPSPTQN